MPINSINPALSESNPGNRRHQLATEILNTDELLRDVIFEGLGAYDETLERDSTRESESGAVFSLERSAEELQLLNVLMQQRVYGSMPVQAENMFISEHNTRTAKISLGARAQKGEAPVNQLEFRVDWDTPATSAETRESDTVAAYHGISPERIVTNRREPLVRVSTTIKRVRYDENARGVRFDSTTGISITALQNGQIVSVQGLMYRGGTPHFTENLIPMMDQGIIRDMRLDEETLDRLHRFTQ